MNKQTFVNFLHGSIWNIHTVEYSSVNQYLANGEWGWGAIADPLSPTLVYIYTVF